MKLKANNEKLGCSEKGKIHNCTSVVFIGVLIVVGLQGMGQRSRHSGWVTTRQSWQRRHIFPNFVLRPQATQNSDLITLIQETPVSTWSEELNDRKYLHGLKENLSGWSQKRSVQLVCTKKIISILQPYSFGDKVVFLSSSRGSELKWIWDWYAGSFTGCLRLVSSGCISPCLGSCKEHMQVQIFCYEAYKINVVVCFFF